MRRSPVPADLKVSIEGPEKAVLTWGDSSLAVSLIATARARRVRATLNGTTVAVRYPARITKRRLASSIYALSGWIMAAQVESDRRSQTPKDIIFLDGRPVRLTIETGRSKVEPHDNALVIRAPDGKADDVLHLWLRRRAAETLPPLVVLHARRMGLDYAKVRIAAQTRRWGSCSSKGTISLNYRLTMAPPEVQEYLVIHELAHLKEMNAGSRKTAGV